MGPNFIKVLMSVSQKPSAIGIGRAGKELLHDVVDGIGYSGCGVLGIDRFRIGRVEQRADRKKKRVHVANLIVGFCP